MMAEGYCKSMSAPELWDEITSPASEHPYSLYQNSVIPGHALMTCLESSNSSTSSVCGLSPFPTCDHSSAIHSLPQAERCPSSLLINSHAYPLLNNERVQAEFPTKSAPERTLSRSAGLVDERYQEHGISESYALVKANTIFPCASMTTHHDDETVDSRLSYAKLIRKALLSVESHSMRLEDIYQWFRDNTDKAAEEPDGKGWTNSVRSNLSINKAFRRKTINSNKADGLVSRRISEWYLEEWALDPAEFASTSRYRPRRPKGVKPRARAPKRSGAGRKGGISSRYNRLRRIEAKQEATTPSFNLVPSAQSVLYQNLRETRGNCQPSQELISSSYTSTTACPQGMTIMRSPNSSYCTKRRPDGFLQAAHSFSALLPFNQPNSSKIDGGWETGSW